MKILIATATAGAGHLQAAVALEEAWRLFRPKDEVKRLDILDFTSRLYRKAYAEGYVKVAEKTPELYAHAFRKTDDPVLVGKMTRLRRLSARIVAGGFIRWVDHWKPDLVLCPHFLPMEALGSVRGHRGHHQPHIVTIVTDFEAHALWMEPGVDLYAVATEATKARLVARGVPARKIIATGIPVSQRFVMPAPRGKSREALRIPSGAPVLLVLGGGLGMGPLAETLAEIDKLPREVRIIVVAGRNETLRQALARKRYRHPVQVLGYVSNMEAWMNAADLVVTKPGGLTSSEAMALGKPMLIVNPLPGQEAANSDFLLEQGAAVKVNRLEDLPYRLTAVLKPAKLNAMARAAKRIGRPNAARAICRAVLKGLLLLAVLCAGPGAARAAESVQDQGGISQAVLHSREKLQDLVRYVNSRPDLFPSSPLSSARLLTRGEKEEVWSVWNSFVEHVFVLDSLQSSHQALIKSGALEVQDGFPVRYAAFLSEYRWALELLKRLDNDSGFKVILNEPVPEVGLPGGTFDRLKFRFLNVAAASQFAAMKVVYQAHRGLESPEIRASIQEDEAALWKAGKGRGEVLTLKNGLDLVRKTGFTLWFPVQTGVSEWMGDTKVWRQEKSLIQPEQIRQIRGQLLPGDILLERREWYLSNIGLPGYWPHAALYVGSPEERRAAWGRKAEKTLQTRYPEAYAKSVSPFEGHPPAVLEAMSDGVVFTSLEHSAAADSLVVLRPRLPKAEKAHAMLRAFHYAGRPYDFNFDFATDSAIVCSELVYKAYEPTRPEKGIHFILETLLGRQVASPNRMARQFDEEYGTPQQQLDMVLFLDGHERSGQASPATLTEFRQSWKRPKWHIWIQEKPE